MKFAAEPESLSDATLQPKTNLFENGPQLFDVQIGHHVAGHPWQVQFVVGFLEDRPKIPSCTPPPPPIFVNNAVNDYGQARLKMRVGNHPDHHAVLAQDDPAFKPLETGNHVIQ